MLLRARTLRWRVRANMTFAPLFSPTFIIVVIIDVCLAVTYNQAGTTKVPIQWMKKGWRMLMMGCNKLRCSGSQGTGDLARNKLYRKARWKQVPGHIIEWMRECVEGQFKLRKEMAWEWFSIDFGAKPWVYGLNHCGWTVTRIWLKKNIKMRFFG